MSYEVTATRRRPRTFDELIGQEFVVATLKNSLASGRIAHAYLFAGPRGVGKTSAARILAKALNCPDGPGAEGCEEWDGSEEIARGTALDVIEIDGASNTSVNDVRQIKDEVLFAPNTSRYKIYIIDEVHMLSNSAFNALLKTIEEPPPYIIFIFATTEIHKVPATIRSRCQQFNFRLIGLDRIKESLAVTARELSVAAEDDALGWIARQATGSLRDAYTLFDQVLAFSENHVTLEMIHEKLGLLGMERLNALLTAVVQRDVTVVLELVEEALLSGVSVERFTMDLADYVRTLLLVKNGVVREAILGINVDRIPAEIREGLTRTQLETANELVLQLYRDLRYSVNQRFDLELVLSRLAHLTTYVEPQELVERVQSLQHELIHSAAYRRREGHSEWTEPESSATNAPAEDSPKTHAPADASMTDASTAPSTDDHSPTEDRQGINDEPTTAPIATTPIAADPVVDSISAPTAASTPVADHAPVGSDPAAGDAQDDPIETNPDDPPVLGGIKQDQVDAIIARFRTQRIGVAALLARASSWMLGDGHLVISFSDNFCAHTLEPDRELVQNAAKGVLERDTLRVSITVDGDEDEGDSDGGEGADDEQVEMVRRVFRGEIVEDQK